MIGELRLPLLDWAGWVAGQGLSVIWGCLASLGRDLARPDTQRQQTTFLRVVLASWGTTAQAGVKLHVRDNMQLTFSKNCAFMLVLVGEIFGVDKSEGDCLLCWRQFTNIHKSWVTVASSSSSFFLVPVWRSSNVKVAVLLTKLKSENLGSWIFVCKLVPFACVTTENLSKLGLSLLSGSCPAHVPVMWVPALEWGLVCFTLHWLKQGE